MRVDSDLRVLPPPHSHHLPLWQCASCVVVESEHRWPAASLSATAKHEPAARATVAAFSAFRSMGGFKDLPTLQSSEKDGHIVAIATIVGLILVQQLLRALESSTRAHEHAKVMLQHGYRELATMGLIAFALFIIEQSDGLQSASKHTLAVFEGVHIMLFVLAIIYLLLVIAVVQLSVLQSNEWARMERTFAFDLNAYHALRARFHSLRRLLAVHSRRKSTQLCTRACLTLLHPRATAEYWRARATMRFLEHRFKSVRQEHMRPEESFAALLKARSSSVFTDLVQLPLGAWVAFVYVIAWDLLLRAVWQAYADAVSTHVVIIAGCACVCAASIVVYFKVRDIHWRVMLTPTRRAQPHVMPTPKPSSPQEGDAEVEQEGEDASAPQSVNELARMHDTPMSAEETAPLEGDDAASPGTPPRPDAAEAENGDAADVTAADGANDDSDAPVEPRAVRVRFAEDQGSPYGSGVIRARRAVSSGSFIFAHTGMLNDPSSPPALEAQPRDDTRSLFWFRAPLLLLRLMQCIMCIGALTLAHALVYTYTQAFAGAYIAVSASSLVLACVCMRMCVPLVIIVMHADAHAISHDEEHDQISNDGPWLLPALQEHSHVCACLHMCLCVAALSHLRVLPLFIVCAVTASLCVCDAAVRVRGRALQPGVWVYVAGSVASLICACAAAILVSASDAASRGDTATRVLTCISAVAPALTQLWGYYTPTPRHDAAHKRVHMVMHMFAHVVHVGLGVRPEPAHVAVDKAVTAPTRTEPVETVQLPEISRAVADAIGRDVCAQEDLTVSLPHSGDDRIQARRLHSPSLRGLFAPLQLQRKASVEQADGAAAGVRVMEDTRDRKAAPGQLRVRAPQLDAVGEDVEEAV